MIFKYKFYILLFKLLKYKKNDFLSFNFHENLRKVLIPDINKPFRQDCVKVYKENVDFDFQEKKSIKGWNPGSEPEPKKWVPGFNQNFFCADP